MNRLSLEWRFCRIDNLPDKCWLEFFIDGESLAKMLATAVRIEILKYLKRLKLIELRKYIKNRPLDLYSKTESIGIAVLMDIWDRENGRLEHSYFAEHRSYLLAQQPPIVADSDRVPFYVCPCCGDYDCGLIGAHVYRISDCIVWSDFRQIDYYEMVVSKRKRIPGTGDCAIEWAGIGPFIFNYAEYEQCLRNPPPIPAEFVKRFQA